MHARMMTLIYLHFALFSALVQFQVQFQVQINYGVYQSNKVKTHIVHFYSYLYRDPRLPFPHFVVS